MGGLSPLHWMLVLLVVVLLFGTGRISSVMADFAKGLKAFKKNMAEDDVSMETSDHRPSGTIAPPGEAKAAPQPETTSVPR
jgi:sec-independent protein translocase protein TatA